MLEFGDMSMLLLQLTCEHIKVPAMITIAAIDYTLQQCQGSLKEGLLGISSMRTPGLLVKPAANKYLQLC
jgi:hypothetical protein